MIGILVHQLRATVSDVPELSLFSADGESIPITSKSKALSPRSTLSEVFHAWFRPVALARSAPNTVKLYLDALKYWVPLTNDPELRDIDDVVTADFAVALQTATYRRSPQSKERLLSESTQAKHLKAIRSLLNRCGHHSKKNEPCRRLVKDVPFVCIPYVEYEPKDPFEMEVMRAMVRQIHIIYQPRRDEQYLTFDQWRAFFAALLYTGLRVKTVLSLRRKFLIEDRGWWWLDIPSKAVSKTNKAFKKVVHPQLVELFSRLPAKGNELLIPWPVGMKTLSLIHEKLQLAGGITPDAFRGFHGWRRSHATEVGRLGSKAALEIARKALDHADSRTTQEHYTNLEPELVRQIPELFNLPKVQDRQMLLF